MASLSDLKKFSEILIPALKDIFATTGEGDDRPDADLTRAIDRLKKLVSEAADPTPASLAQRSEAIVAARAVLNEIIIQGCTNAASLSESTVLTIQAQRNALRNQFALLLEKSVFEDIPRLLSDNDMDRFSNQLERAQKDIEDRRKAKQTVDTVVSVALLAAKLAAKLA
ncbi:MAG TPA: hypothetical protein VGJ57_05645 [Nitrospirales bacterium]|jgi:hypothetical protein